MTRRSTRKKVSGELKKTVNMNKDSITEQIESINTAIKAAADTVVPPRKVKRSAPRLKVASSKMKLASAKNKQAF